MFEEQRAAPREKLALALKLSDGTLAVTKDVSASGLCVRLTHPQQLGSRVQFELASASAPLTFSSEGKVVRRQSMDGVEHVGIQFTSTRLSPQD